MFTATYTTSLITLLVLKKGFILVWLFCGSIFVSIPPVNILKLRPSASQTNQSLPEDKPIICISVFSTTENSKKLSNRNTHRTMWNPPTSWIIGGQSILIMREKGRRFEEKTLSNYKLKLCNLINETLKFDWKQIYRCSKLEQRMPRQEPLIEINPSQLNNFNFIDFRERAF